MLKIFKSSTFLVLVFSFLMMSAITLNPSVSYAQACVPSATVQCPTTVTQEVNTLMQNPEIRSFMRIAVILFSLLMLAAAGFFLFALGNSLIRIMQADDERAKFDAIDQLKAIAVKLIASFILMSVLTIVLNVLSFVAGAGLFKLIFDSFFKWS